MHDFFVRIHKSHISASTSMKPIFISPSTTTDT